MIEKLITAQVESYHVDYRVGRATYFLSTGESLDMNMDKPKNSIAENFDPDAVRSAILDAQQGKIMYPEFKGMTQAAGCIGYTVWIAGRQVTYYGRKGETHIEKFPVDSAQ